MALEEVGAFNKLENKHTEKPVPSSIRRRELSVIETTFGGAVVEEVRTIFEKRNDATIYIPDMQSIAVLG
jgi:hypothetical protein